MMDVYRCEDKHTPHQFMRASIGTQIMSKEEMELLLKKLGQEWIPCSYCRLWAKYVETVDERAIGNGNNSRGGDGVAQA